MRCIRTCGCTIFPPAPNSLSITLYPHMRVYDNIALNLRVDKIPKPEIDRRVHDVARLLNIEHLLERRPRAMSGGQQQRVALGRAIVRNPAYFLMDEPLSNLDAKLRLAMRSEIRRLHDRIGATTAYGLSRWQMYWLIALPMSVPTVNTVAILQTVYIWNEFLFCLVLVRSPERFTMPRALMTFKGTFITAFGPLNAAVILSAVPTIIIYFVFADRIRRGMSMGFSAKG